MRRLDAREIALQCYHAAVRGADPERVTAEAVAGLDLESRRAWILALGKGSVAMARGAREALVARRVETRGGLIVPQASPQEPVPDLELLCGDHPVPGDGSLRAATRLGEIAATIPDQDDVLVLLSGGTTSLIAAPVTGVRMEDLRALFDALLGSGADIVVMNALRKRVLRWGAGRLAAALEGRRVHCLIASDVPADSPASVGSGPCSPDPMTAAELRQLVADARLEAALPPAVEQYLERVASGEWSETPKPGAPCFARVSVEVILDLRQAVAAAAEEARALGAATVLRGRTPLSGDAATTGAGIALYVAGWRDAFAGASLGGPAFAAAVFAGETTVRLPAGATGRGGRCQELALACARALHELGPRGHGITVLAAGTDGRDGPTDAAGAIVDASTWTTIAGAGIDPAVALETRDAYPALDRVRALIRTGPTGTNVNDIVVAIVTAAAPPAPDST